ncbi:ras-specific guanine nucleotide-releasing factor 2-like isoform X4 [Plodia interpunctella]|uniref:ras-specific guanine nucleotide-releasing factor 2-like isoform X4 n=1 Tax=Plodia interpunctella TaxID=58824 RepID=UPI0023684C1D|nr:ras-specific guanine nucleotide-releasing factor 2-like isoform X4 [Plodia interpunctella]
MKNVKMLSPKIQRSIRVNEGQLMALSERAQYDHSQASSYKGHQHEGRGKFLKRAGYLHKKTSDSGKWQMRWCILYQNLLFYYESENSTRPTGVLLLEGSYCERLSKSPMERNASFCFTISYRRESQRQYEMRAASEVDCVHWVDAIREASFNKLLLQKEELEQKQLHLLQVVESERTSRWQYAQQCDELSSEVKKLRTELCTYKKEHAEPATRAASTTSLSPTDSPEIDPAELRKIKKVQCVQSFFRGWLCRRRWKQIVEQYIKSPHAESMRKRNSLVFKMVEAEEEYLEQMEILVTCFLRPFKMAASSKKPPCTHEDVNSIFLNSETVLFLHQIFFKGLTSRMESWPTLVLGDLFDMLLPMLTIYQEYVRNHHYSLQVLTECKQSQPFAQLLARLETKPACQGRSLETFLTYPMHQIPRYIITLHELLAHTPHDHVERRSLQHARAQLEELSRQMHDEVSETENLRKNLAVERMIIEGCDILLDVNQVFIRQGILFLQTMTGTLSQVVGKGRRAQLHARQAFLFSNHLLLTTRATGGRLHLPPAGRLPLHDALLVEDPSNHDDDDSTSVCSSPGGESYQGRDFKILVEVKGEQICAHLVAATLEEKAAWTSELAQCMESAALTELLRACGSCGAASASLPACRSDRALFTDDVDIRFSRTLNSCKVPQIRSATPQRLLQRLTDLRFLSVDFLNTFLLTYRVFTDGVTVLEALKQVFYEQSQQELELAPPPDATRKTSGASSVSGYGSEYSDRDWQSRFWRASRKSEDDDKLSPYLTAPSRRTSSVSKTEEDNSHLTIPKIMATSSSNETLKGASPSSPGAISSVTLVGSPKKTSPVDNTDTTKALEKRSPTKDNDAAAATIMKDESIELVDQSDEDTDKKYKEEEQEKNSKYKITDNFKISQRFSELYTQHTYNLCQRVRTMSESPRRLQPSAAAAASEARRRSDSARDAAANTAEEQRRASDSGARYAPRRSVSERRYTNSSINSERRRYWVGSEPRSSVTSQVSQVQNYRRETSQPKAGVVITSFRQSHRSFGKDLLWSSTSTAAVAFAVATSASSNPRSPPPTSPPATRRDSVISTAATMRVLNVLRHWISKHSYDFWSNERLRGLTMDFLKEIEGSPGLLPAEHKAAAQLLRLLERAPDRTVDLKALFAPPRVPTKESIETLSALEIAEQMTYLDYQIFSSIHSEEFLGQAWTKADKAERAPHILMMTAHFNHISNLVISEILKKYTLVGRVAAIEKWAAVADIARCLHNFNGVLQVCAALSNTSVYRLKKTWEKVSKTTKQTIERMQTIISSECRFRILRDALHRCDPPCIPYLGMYLSDLSFIEEGTSNYTPDGLLNFSKMRMIAHVIREIRNFQQTPYKIDHIPKVCDFLLDRSLVIPEERQYTLSLEMEPRVARGSGAGLHSHSAAPASPAS